MKKDLIYAPAMLAVGILLFLFKATGLPVHIAVAHRIAAKRKYYALEELKFDKWTFPQNSLQ